MNRHATVTGQFEWVATTIAERVAKVLDAEVTVLNEQGQPIAIRPCMDEVGLADDWLLNRLHGDALRVPIQVDGQNGEVVITAAIGGEMVSPRLAHVLVELMISQAMMVARLPNQQELKSKLISNLLLGSISNEADSLREAQILGMDFSRPRAVILIDASEYILAPHLVRRVDMAESQVWRRAQLIVSSIVSFFHLPDDTICAYIGDGEIAVLKASSTQDLAAWTSHDDMPGQSNSSWANLTALKRASGDLLKRLRYDTQATLSIGIGRYHPGLQGLAHSYQDARAALSLGRRYRGENQVHCLDELGIAAFVGISDEQTKIDLARHLLSPLNQEPELIETLDVFFNQNCYPSQTACQLCIHRNTLSYRLDKIASLTGLDPRLFDDAMQIRLAMLLRRLQGDSGQLGKCPTITCSTKLHAGQMPNVSIG